VSDQKPSEWAMALVRAASRYNDGCCETCRVGLEHEAAEIDTAIREAVEADRRSGPETVTFTLDKDGTELTFIIGVEGYFTIDSLQEIEQEVRDNIGDYYDPEFADAGGQAIEKFTVRRVNNHPDDGGGYWELEPFITVAEETPESDKIENIVRARRAQEG